MKRLFLPRWAVVFLAGFTVWSGARADQLADGFVDPSDATRPRCYWYWLNGNISKEGLTRDLEMMRTVGIGEGMIGVIEGGGSLKALTDPWWGMFEHAVREGTRLGVDVGVFNCPGWSQSGGPWVKPSQSMRYVVLPELRLTGPRRFQDTIRVPTNFQDIAVLAFPAPAGDTDTAAARGAKIERTPTNWTWELPAPFTARSVTVRPAKAVRTTGALEASDDGVTFRPVRRFDVDRHLLELHVGPVPLAPITVTFPAVTARHFRMRFTQAAELADIEITGAARVDRSSEKQLLKVYQGGLPPFDFYSWPPSPEPDDASLVVNPASITNLTALLASDGTLTWDVPPGEWVVQRAGMLPTGTRNAPAPPEATGLEIDKMNRAPLAAHFDAFVGELLRRVPKRERASLKHVVADSYEMGPQNWTDGFAADFRARYGYDPLKFLPALSGRVIGSADQTDRFLWDLRRLIADRIATEYVGGLRDLCRKNGLRMWLENYGHWGFPAEFLQYGGQCDEIGGEFWVNGDTRGVELRCASSAANTYGFPVTYAEAFTGGPLFQNTPWNLKARGDWAFCHGINHFVLHVNIHQPDDARRPGMSAWYGTEFNRHNTWFPLAKPWIDYLRRCHFLLQQGHRVADVAYFIGEDAPKMTGIRQPELPAGYDFDYINADVLLTRARVENRRLVLKSGATYGVLVLPPLDTMRPETLEAIARFAEAGLAVVGPLPKRSPSLQGFPAADERVRELAQRLQTRGLVTATNALDAVLKQAGLPPDLTDAPAPGILFTHRRDAATDLYFISNQSDGARQITPGFRVTGRAVELWDPVSGRRTAPERVEPGDNQTRVTLSLPPRGSVFVVFREGPQSSPPRGRTSLEIRSAVYEAENGTRGTNVTAQLTALAAGGTLSLPVSNDTLGSDPAYGLVKQLRVTYACDGRTGTVTVAEGGWLTLPPGDPINGPWQLDIAGRRLELGALTSWTKQDDPQVRHFSGVATYRTTFTHAGPVSGRRALLELGTLHGVATVRLNGRELGGVWCAPWQVDATRALRAGTNSLEVTVANTWHNRLVGDAALPAEQRTTFASHQTLRAGRPLQESGLLGPVSLRFADDTQASRKPRR